MVVECDGVVVVECDGVVVVVLWWWFCGSGKKSLFEEFVDTSLEILTPAPYVVQVITSSGR